MTAQQAAPLEFTTLEDAVAESRPFESSETYKANKKYVVGKLGALQASHRPFGVANLLNNRFMVDVSREEGTFSKTYAKAYAVTDTTAQGAALVGYVIDPNHPHREAVLQKLKEQHHPHLMDLVESGIVFIEPWQANRFVILYYKPSEVMKRLIIPVAAALYKLDALGINHGGIHPRNIFISPAGVVLGECITEPAGASQPLLYEPIEHLQAMPQARGNGAIASDMYALAMLALDAVGELATRKHLTRGQLVSLLISKGAYHCFVNEGIFSGQIIDFFRATLIENADERWGTEQLLLCAGGKRYNLIPPAMPRDSNRAYHFDGGDYATLRALSQAFSVDAEKAFSALRDVKLMKWLETMPYRTETKAAMEKICSRARRLSATNSQLHELVARACSALDTQSPMRYKDISAQPDHFSLLMLHAIMTGDAPLIATFQELLTADMVVFWRDLHPTHFSRLGWDAEVVRMVVKHHSLGFGAERLMYEMNPSLPCMSSAYLPYYAMNAKTVLLILDSDAATGKEPPLYDKHLMAFIAARAGIRKEVKIAEFKDYPELYNSKPLQSLVILARAQEKTRTIPLHGLTGHAAMHIIEMIELFHSRDIRASLSRDLQTVLPKGNLAYLLRVLHNRDYLSNDKSGYALAKDRFSRNHLRLVSLQDRRTLQRRADEKGLYTAFFISLMILLAVSLHMLTTHSQ
jgi:eukaryotic-like serine/threonine-protein kinase